MMNLGLKPCPFCGADANKAIERIEVDDGVITNLVIHCCGKFEFIDQSEVYYSNGLKQRLRVGDTVIDQWNRMA